MVTSFLPYLLPYGLADCRCTTWWAGARTRRRCLAGRARRGGSTRTLTLTLTLTLTQTLTLTLTPTPTLTLTLTQTQTQTLTLTLTRWINEDKLKRLAFPPAADTAVWLCGVDAMYTSLAGSRLKPLAPDSVLARLGYSEDMVWRS